MCNSKFSCWAKLYFSVETCIYKHLACVNFFTTSFNQQARKYGLVHEHLCTRLNTSLRFNCLCFQVIITSNIIVRKWCKFDIAENVIMVYKLRTYIHVCLCMRNTWVGISNRQEFSYRALYKRSDNQ